MMLSVPIFRSPAVRYRQALAPEREAAAWHEAGHAVTAVLSGLPIHRVRIGYRGRRTRRTEEWQVVSAASITFHGGAFRKTSHADLVAVMAGAEAEALYLIDGGMTRAEARAAARNGNDGDERQALRFAGGDPAAVQEAADKAAILVRLRRPAIEETAFRLQARGTLSGDDVRAVVAETVPAGDSDLDAWLWAIGEVAEDGRDAGTVTEALLDAGQAAVDRINAIKGRS